MEVEIIKEVINGNEKDTGSILPIFIVFGISVFLNIVTGCVPKLDDTKNSGTRTTHITTDVTSSIEHIETAASVSSGGGRITISGYDWVCIRRYASPEPVWT